MPAVLNGQQASLLLCQNGFSRPPDWQPHPRKAQPNRAAWPNVSASRCKKCGQRREVTKRSAFFAESGGTPQNVPHFLRKAAGGHKTLRIFCGRRRDTTKRPAFFAEGGGTPQNAPHFLRKAAGAPASRAHYGNKKAARSVTENAATL